MIEHGPDKSQRWKDTQTVQTRLCGPDCTDQTLQTRLCRPDFADGEFFGAGANLTRCTLIVTIFTRFCAYF